MEMAMEKVHIKMSHMIEGLDLKLMNPSEVFDDWEIWYPQTYRPALQLAGYFDEFSFDRIQLLGRVECHYLRTLTRETRIERYSRLLAYKLPCVIFCHKYTPDEDFLRIATEKHVPVLCTETDTAHFNTLITLWMNEETAPETRLHGVLVDVYGEGVLITGDSGMGKSETALALLKSGHRLVADDIVGSAGSVRTH